MSTSSTESIPPVSIGESNRGVVKFTIKLPREQPLSPAFMNLGIVMGLVYEHITVEPVVVQRLGDRNTLLDFEEGEILRIYVKSCGQLKYGWITVYTLDVMLPHQNR